MGARSRRQYVTVTGHGSQVTVELVYLYSILHRTVLSMYSCSPNISHITGVILLLYTRIIHVFSVAFGQKVK